MDGGISQRLKCTLFVQASEYQNHPLLEARLGEVGVLHDASNTTGGWRTRRGVVVGLAVVVA